ncbi:MAG: UvrD-helicase domain-containing protein [Myxococcales bacterium]|nr:UvrD-helicase domain-containing protein [Myxococcales bacterium]
MVSLGHLNPEQRDAVLHQRGPLLILAGAGSGKTRVIVHRIAYLLDQGEAPQGILAVSFTNRAVREMEERVADMIKDRSIVKKLTLSTFHSLGVKILRKELQRLGYPARFTIYDPSDQLALVRRVMRENRIDETFHNAKDLLAAISQAKNLFLDPPDLNHNAHHELYNNVMVLKKTYSLYEDGLRACGAVDFDDLIRLPVKIFRAFPEALHTWSDRYRQIMVDEYQDTNRAQLLMVECLASVHKNLCVVGDDDQSIYGWRGSDVSNILNFGDQFQGTRVIMLTQNYRCSGHILTAANKVIAQNKTRYDKELWTDANPGPRIGLAVLPDEEQEARYTVEHLYELKHNEKRPWRDFAILYRTNAQSRAFEDALRQERIPYKLVGGQTFFERKEVKDTLAYLKVLYQPSDEIALRRIINYPPRSIGTTTIERLSETVREGQYNSLYQACEHVGDIEGLGTSAKNAVAEFIGQIEDFRSRVPHLSLSALTLRLLEEIRLFPYMHREYKNPNEAKSRIDNLSSLINAIEQYEKRVDSPSLDDYLERITLDTREEDDERETEKDAITLITLHGAKGLEYPVVYLVGVEDGFLPFYRQGEDPNVEEERRLCYVGITRAKQRLYILRALERRRFGRNLEREPSRFLKDIPKELTFFLQADQQRKAQSEEERDQKFKSFFSEINSLFSK